MDTEIYVDVNTGTWGDPSGVRIVKVDDATISALEEGQLTDGDIMGALSDALALARENGEIAIWDLRERKAVTVEYESSDSAILRLMAV